MANYRFALQHIRRSSGHKACAAAAYRAGEQVHDERYGIDHDYRRKEGVINSFVIAPDNAPGWMRDRQRLWNGVEANENRKDARLAVELQLNLAHELTPEQNRDHLHAFVRDKLVSRGLVADVNVHAASRDGDERNIHAHVMVALRRVDAEGFGKKDIGVYAKPFLQELREDWARYQNRALERAGHDARVDHRSYEARGMEREPTIHMGPAATAMERNGQQTERGMRNRAVQERNAEREHLRSEGNIIDLALEKERRAERLKEDEQGRKVADRFAALDSARQQDEKRLQARLTLNQARQLHGAFEMRAKAAKARDEALPGWFELVYRDGTHAKTVFETRVKSDGLQKTLESLQKRPNEFGAVRGRKILLWASEGRKTANRGIPELMREAGAASRQMEAVRKEAPAYERAAQELRQAQAAVKKIEAEPVADRRALMIELAREARHLPDRQYQQLTRQNGKHCGRRGGS